MSPRAKKVIGRLLKAGAALSLVAAIATAVFAHWIEQNCIAPEPKLTGIKPTIADESVRTDADGTVRLGKAWSYSHRGVRFLYLQGVPYELGYQNARLSQDVLERQEDVLYWWKDWFLPWSAAQWAMRKGMLFMGRELPGFISDKRKLEILGLARGSKADRHAADAPLYHRVLHYHAIHDYAHLLMENPLVLGRWDQLRAGGCSAFAACGAATRDGHVLLARDFDMELGKIFDDEKVVLIVKPDGGIPFVSVAWSGMAGAVTGVNREGIACVLNAGASDDDAFSGEPISLVVRDVLERARTIDEAVAIVREAHVFVSDSVVIASGKEDRAVVVEKSPARCAVREADAGLILATNHFLAPEFANDVKNGKRWRDATTEERLGRLRELVPPLRGKLDAASCVSVLRDRRGPGGKDVGLGNRGAVDALIATHSVVIDASAHVLWVAAAPHTLGAYLPVSLDAVLDRGKLDPRELDAGAIAEDPLLASGGFDRHMQNRKALLEARDALERGDLVPARELATRARDLDPAFFEAEELLARIELARKDAAAAAQHARAALDRAPPFARVRADLEKIAGGR